VIVTLFDDILTPGSDGSPAYRRGVIAIAHAMLGAALVWPVAALFGPEWVIAAGGIRVAIAGAYWGLKEAFDLQRGGTLADGIEDAAFVAAGTFYGVAWWPVLMILAGGFVMWRASR
jgi:hypothetical protein